MHICTHHISGPWTLHRNGTLPFNHYFYIFNGGKIKLMTHRHHDTCWCFLWCNAWTAVQIIIHCHQYTICKPPYFTLMVQKGHPKQWLHMTHCFHLSGLLSDNRHATAIHSTILHNLLHCFKIHCIFKVFYVKFSFMLSPEFQVLISYLQIHYLLMILKKICLATVQAATAIYMLSTVLLASLACQEQR